MRIRDLVPTTEGPTLYVPITGIDEDCNYGDPVYSTYDGTVTLSENQAEGGNVVKVHSNTDGNYATFAHLKDRAGRIVGDSVKPGDLIGHCNATGSGAEGGNHLHYEVGCPSTGNCFKDPEATHPCQSQ